MKFITHYCKLKKLSNSPEDSSNQGNKYTINPSQSVYAQTINTRFTRRISRAPPICARKPIFCESLQMAKPFPLPFHLVGDKSSSDNSSRSLEPFRNELRSELHPVGCPGPGWAKGRHN